MRARGDADSERLSVLLDYAGVLVFATTGALAAARKEHDFITFFA